MFDARFNKGIVFRIDADAAKEFNLTQDSEFAISRDANAVEIRASRFKDGKPARGRPRKFPTAAVARMLGITDLPAPAPVSQVTVVDSDGNDGDSTEDEARVSSLIAGTTPAAAASSDDATPW